MGATGSVTCNVSGYTGRVLVSAWTDGQNVLGEWVELGGTTKLGDVMDSDDAVFWTMIIFVSIAGMGAANALATIIATVLGLILIYFLGIANWLTVGFIILASIAGVAIALKVKKQ